MAEPRLRRCNDRGELERAVDDLAVQGYKIKSRSEDSALLEKPEYGSGGVHVVLAIFTLGIGNAIYAAVKFSGRDKVMIKVGDPSTPLPAPGA